MYISLYKLFLQINGFYQFESSIFQFTLSFYKHDFNLALISSDFVSQVKFYVDEFYLEMKPERRFLNK